MAEKPTRTTIAHRLTHEVKQYAMATLYLYVCMGALLIYKHALLASAGVSFVPYGVAAIKALILGKFMMVGHALKLGRGGPAGPLIYPILRKSLIFLVLLFSLNMIEEIVSGLIHGRAAAAVVQELTGGTVLQTLAICLLFFLILLPYFAYRELGEALGEGRLWRMMFRGENTTAL